MHKKFLLLFIVALTASGIAYGISRQKDIAGDPSGRFSVAASFYPLYFFGSEIGGSYADIFLITPAGTEPHEYEPTAFDIARMYDSDLILVSGNGLEPWLPRVKDALDGRTPIAVLGDDLATLTDTEEQGASDPHVWLSPTLAITLVKRIEKEFAMLDAEHGAEYAENAKRLIEQLRLLDSEFQDRLQFCKKDSIVTSHAAFGYLAHDYGFTQVAIAGLSPDAEPSLQTLASISSFVKEEGIQYIFFETLVSPKLAETLAKETGAQTLLISALEGLSDEEIGAGKNYFTEMRSNLHQLTLALECN